MDPRVWSVLKKHPSWTLYNFSTDLFFCFSFFWPKGSFVCFDDREISTSEIVICSLLSHHILTPNELICLTPAAIKRSVVFWSLDRPLFIYLAVKRLLNWRLSQLILSASFKMLSKKNAGNFMILPEIFTWKRRASKAMKKPVNPEIWQACG